MSTTHATLHIRWAVLRDIPALMTIDLDAYKCPLRQTEWREMLLEHSHLVTLVAEQDGTVLGFTNYLLAREAIWVERIAVHTLVRRQGIGRAMLAQIQRRVDKGRRRYAGLLISDDTPDVADFVRACGWKAHRIYRPAEPCDGTSCVTAYQYARRDMAREVLDSILQRDGRVVR